jgi:prepilin-type N-terminal cleavage/methylation domain-containing protein
MSQVHFGHRQLQAISCPANKMHPLGQVKICNNTQRCGFTLVELLVVIAVLSLLMAILMPMLSQARQQARRAACAANLRQVGMAIHLYAEAFDDTIPFGPEGRPITGSNFYTVTGNAGWLPLRTIQGALLPGSRPAFGGRGTIIPGRDGPGAK